MSEIVALEAIQQPCATASLPQIGSRISGETVITGETVSDGRSAKTGEIDRSLIDLRFGHALRF